MDKIPRPTPPESESGESSEDEDLVTPTSNVNRDAAARRAAAGASSSGGGGGDADNVDSAAAGGGSKEAKLPVQIRTLDGKTFKINDCKQNWTVRQLRQEFMKWYGEGGDRIVFHYKAKRLAENDPLAKYKIEPHAIIQGNFRSTGGLPKESCCHNVTIASAFFAQTKILGFSLFNVIIS